HNAPFRLRAGNASAVELARRVTFAESAHEYVFVILNRDTADALHGLGGVGVRAPRDLLGGDGVDHADGRTLRIERGVNRSAFRGRAHDQWRQLNRGAGEGDALIESLAALELDTGHGFRGESNASGLQRNGAGRNLGDIEATVHARRNAERGSDHLHADVGQSLAGSSVYHSANQLAGGGVLCDRDGRCNKYEERS